MRNATNTWWLDWWRSHPTQSPYTQMDNNVKTERIASSNASNWANQGDTTRNSGSSPWTISSSIVTSSSSSVRFRWVLLARFQGCKVSRFQGATTRRSVGFSFVLFSNKHLKAIMKGQKKGSCCFVVFVFVFFFFFIFLLLIDEEAVTCRRSPLPENAFSPRKGLVPPCRKKKMLNLPFWRQ